MQAIQIGLIFIAIGIPGGLILLWLIQRRNQQKHLHEIMLSFGFDPQQQLDPYLMKQIQQSYQNKSAIQLKQVFKKQPRMKRFTCVISGQKMGMVRAEKKKTMQSVFSKTGNPSQNFS